MTDKEFYNWFVERAETFADLGIMHPNSEWGKIVRICVIATDERYKELREEIESLKKQLNDSSVPKKKIIKKGE